MEDENEMLIEMLTDKYDEVLTKNYEYQMGDDDYQLSTYEYKLVESINFIAKDLKNQIKK
jgi:hypothetical protein